MIVEPLVVLILHCSRCNTPWTDPDTESPVWWADVDQIAAMFKQAVGADFYGWRRAGDLYLCEDCHIVEGGEVVEKAPLRPVEQAAVLRAQTTYARRIGEVAAYELAPSLTGESR
ncbi:hypothetical protein ACGFNP_25470 [Nonomuraea sp. NPDC049269]|uniref:hypothetical protein n=1 Tax=Nonomuraea sp. NPDC049269 TaxID=3364349 RepID=UPI00371D520E